MSSDSSRRSPSSAWKSTSRLVERLLVVGEVVDEADVPVVVSTIRSELRRFTIDLVDITALSTIAAELASNIVKYARKGEIRVFLRLDERGLPHDVTIWAEDEGPGIDDLDLAMREHFSTSGSLGLGLSGVVRLSDRFDIESRPSEGLSVRAARRLRSLREH